MATTTATAVIGQHPPSSGGIDPTHLLFLVEGDRPSLSLFKIKREGTLHRLGTWIPTVENMLEDLVLMCGALTRAQPEIAEALKKEFSYTASRIDLRGMVHERRAELYGLSRKTPFLAKIVLTVLEDSTLVEQAFRLRDYQADCEVCMSSRAKSEPNRKEIVHG